MKARRWTVLLRIKLYFVSAFMTCR
jgi:hypothetical protein